MATSRLGRSAWRWTGAVFALLTFGVVAPPATVRAGCVHGSAQDHPVVAGRFDRLVQAGAIPSSVGHLLEDPAEPSTPCQGALCSRSRPIPLASAPLGQIQHWVCLVDRPTIPVQGSLTGFLDDIDRRPARLAPSIFHPPRPI
jgi:hypothetical protein